MGAEPSRCLVLEDSRPGVEAARAAGMTVALYTGGSHMRGRPFADPPPVTLASWADFAATFPASCRGGAS
jgi:beta-phosphoglucomutase-like phosphatase (HAD superfamily)